MMPPEKFLRIIDAWCAEHDIATVHLSPVVTQERTISAGLIAEKADAEQLAHMIENFPDLNIIDRQDLPDRFHFMIDGMLTSGRPFQFDLLHELSMVGLSYLTVRAVLLRAVQDMAGSGQQQTVTDLALTTLFERILRQPAITDIDRQTVQSAYKNGPAFADLVSLYFGSTGERRLDRLLYSSDIAERLQLSGSLRSSFYLRHLKHHGMMSVFYMARSVFKRFRFALDQAFERQLRKNP